MSEKTPLRISRWWAALLAGGVLAALAVAWWLGSDSPAPPSGLSDSQKRRRIETMYEDYKRSFPDTPELTVEELLPLLRSGEQKLILVDVRDLEERQVSMIPGAISAEQFEQDTDRYREHTIVVYCTIGYRSGRYAAKLALKGLRGVNLRGGILSWAHAGQTVVDAAGPTKRVHVWGRKWALLPEGYQRVL